MKSSKKVTTKAAPVVFRKQFELFKIPEFYTYYIDYDRLSYYLD